MVCHVLSQTIPIPPSPLLTITPAGVATTLATTAGVPNSSDVDQDGTHVVAIGTGNNAGATHFLQRVTTGGVVTTILTSPISPNCFAVDGDTGDYIIALFNVLPNGALLRVNRTSLAITTIAPALGRMSGVDFEPQTGNFVCTRFDAGTVLRITPGGVITTLLPAGANNAIKVNEENGEILAAGGTNVSRFSPAGTIITTRAFAGFSFTGIEITGSRKVSGSGNFQAGSVYNVNFSFPQSSGSSYVAALSTGLRPGIPLADGTGRVINLAISPLLLISIGGIPGITTGFSGTLNALGQASGTITLPAGFPAGVRIQVSAVAVNGALPSGLDTANSLGITSN
jgi:hypothetical protein